MLQDRSATSASVSACCRPCFCFFLGDMFVCSVLVVHVHGSWAIRALKSTVQEA
jgi:hypothetical protein